MINEELDFLKVIDSYKIEVNSAIFVDQWVVLNKDDKSISAFSKGRFFPNLPSIRNWFITANPGVTKIKQVVKSGLITYEKI